jgi:hypothetical protein
MSCCGRSGAGVATPVAPHRAASAARPAPIVFERVEEGPLTMFGRVTGARYHFADRGARLRVDGRDAPVLGLVRGLVEVAADGRA